jgi:adenylosuccinate synthase
VRGTGGPNAGHTTIHGEQKIVTNLLPSGIRYDSRGVINIIGSGVAVDPHIVSREIDTLRELRLTYKGLYIAKNAKLILPHHVLFDRLQRRFGVSGIGTTGRGVGPCFTDHVDRLGMEVNDLLNPGVFLEKLDYVLKIRSDQLRQFNVGDVLKVLDSLRIGYCFDSKDVLNAKSICDHYCAFADRLGKMIIDTDDKVADSLGHKHVVLEGAQGILLSIDHGTYPDVTSSDCATEGLAKGCGVPVQKIDHVFGVAKAFYMTRVGNGPFPTEIGGAESATWCASKTRKEEEELFPNPSLESASEFEQGIAIRKVGKEYGSTTGRPRRTGWFDQVALRYACRYLHPDKISLALTKIDVLDRSPSIRICTRYQYTGPTYRSGAKVLQSGDEFRTAVMDRSVLKHCVPVYETYQGWCTDTSQITCLDQLPRRLADLVSRVQEAVTGDVDVISVGADQEQTIIRQ